MMQGNEPMIWLSIYVCVCVYIYYMCIFGCSSIFLKLHKTYILWKRGVSGSLSEFHKILKEIVKGQLQHHTQIII